MTRKILGFALAACLVAGPAAAADLAGQWNIQASIAGRDIPLDCTFHQDGNKLSGKCTGPGAENGVKLSGTTSDDKAAWSYTVNVQGRSITLNYKADVKTPTTMSGTIGMMGQSGSFTGTKK